MTKLLLSNETLEKSIELNTKELSVPKTALEISEHLGFSDYKKAEWAWLELAGAVLSHYLVEPKDRFQALLSWFYNDLGFCVKEDYFGANAADLGQCLLTRQGNSTTLAIVLMLLAKQLDLKLEPILLPAQTLLHSKIDGQTLYIDPLTGKGLERHQMHAFVRGELGNAAPFKASYLKPVNMMTLLTRVLHELKAGAIVSARFEEAMECCNLLLQWNPDDVHLHRERAFIAQQLGCITLATADLKYFIEQSPHDPVIDLVKIQLRELSDHAETFH